MEKYIGLIGVFLGFLLSQFATTWRDLWKAREAVKLIKEEVKANLAVLPERRDVVVKVFVELEKKRVLPAQGVPFLTESYKYNLHLAYSTLSPIERDSLHVFYERLRLADSYLANFEAELLKHLDLKLIDDPYSMFAIRMKEILESFDVIETLGKEFLAGKPVDVFYRTRQNGPPKKFA